MDLPPPSPSTSPAASSVSAQVLGVSDEISASAIWDWGSLLDFALEAEDALILPWDAPDPRSLSSEAATPADRTPIVPPAAGSSRSSRVRKRDPRLVCANYLAGRVPCACPEVDEKEMEDDEEEPVLGGRKRARAGVMNVRVCCQVPGCDADIRELKGYHRRHRVCLRCANASSVMLDGGEKRYCQQCGKFHVLLDFDKGKRSCRRKLEKHNRRRRRKPADLSGVTEKESLSQAEQPEYTVLDTDQIQETPEVSACKGVDNGARNNALLIETFAGLEQAQTSSPLSLGASNASIDGRVGNPISVLSSSICNNKASYSSTCPTGRISFKLYDWNPAEFPRRLRHQIFQWLASMPVELEGYIRPGCTILTVFIAMPQHMWEKLSRDGALYIKQLINSPESLLSGKGSIFIYLSNMIVHVLKDRAWHIKMKVNAPKLHFVHPTYFEAGKAMKFFACGSNLDQPKLRFLVSFAGKYLACDARRVLSHRKIKCFGETTVFSGSNSGHEMFMIYIKRTAPEIFGPAFIEVENESGISNFIPILIGHKQVCSELENLRGALNYRPNVHEDNSPSNAAAANAEFGEFSINQIEMSNLLVDIAWLLKKPCNDYNKSFLGSLNLQRLKYMLQFSMQNQLISVLKAILKYVSVMIQEVGFLNTENLTVNADFLELLECVETARKYIYQRIQRKERSKLDLAHSNFIEALLLSIGENLMITMTTANVVEERRNAHNLVSTSTMLSSCSGESASIIPKDREARSLIPFLRLHSYLPCRCWLNNVFSPPITQRWASLFVMGSFVICFYACIILLGPHNSHDFAVYMAR